MMTIDEIRKRLAEYPPEMKIRPVFSEVEMRLVLEALDKVTKERDDAWFTLDNSR